MKIFSLIYFMHLRLLIWLEKLRYFDCNFPHKRIWNPLVPQRVKAFVWTVVFNRINTKDVLQRRRPFMALSPSWCIMCKSENESPNHIFLHCRFAVLGWNYFFFNKGMTHIWLYALKDFVWQWFNGGQGIHGRIFGIV